MPQVPIYNRQFDKNPVDLNAPKQNFNTPDEAFGAGSARSLISAGRGVTDIGTSLMIAAKRIKDEEDETKALDAYARYHDALNVYLQGDGSEGSGLYNRLGGSAVGVTKEAQEAMEKDRERIASELDNESQRRLFNRRAIMLRSENLASVSRHEAQQRKVYKGEMYKAIADREASYAILNFTNPEQVDAALGRMDESVRAAAQMKGMSPEATDKLLTDTRSSALKGVAMRHIENGNFGIARSIMSDSRLTGEDVSAIEKSLKSGSDKAKSYELFRTAMDSEDPLSWLAEKKDLDPNVRDQAEQRIKSEITWRRTEKHEAERIAGKEAEDALVKALDSKDIDTAMQLVEDAPEGMRKEFRAYVNSRLAGKDITDDPAESWKWTQMLANDPEQFKKEWNSPAMIAKLSPSTREKFDNAYVALGKKQNAPILDEITSDKDILQQTAVVLGIKVKNIKSDTEVAKKYGELEREYTRLVQQEMAVKGRKLTTSEKQAIVDEQILYKGKVKGTFYGTNEAYLFNAKYDKDKTFRPSAEYDPVGTVRWEARKQGVSESLASAVLLAESNGSQGAISKRGATGLMQLMPGTAKDLGVDPSNPDENIRGGVMYLKQMIDSFGDARLALVAYNWGPGNTKKWIEAGCPPDALPKETYAYVNKVFKYIEKGGL